MAILDVASVAFCRTLLQSGLLLRWLAMGGIVGYSVFALGGVLQLSVYHVGLALSAPGGLFEVVAGSYVLVKGFRQVTPVRTDSADQSGGGAVLDRGSSSRTGADHRTYSLPRSDESSGKRSTPASCSLIGK